jgi:exopolysaccharide biosynthesis polyprenyl glycosylphosphotransferase
VNAAPGKLIAFWLLSVPAVIAGRLVARAACRRSEAYQQNTVIVGAGTVGQLVARKIRHHAEYGLNLLGFVDDDPRPRVGEFLDVPILGSLADLTRVVDEMGADRVVVAYASGDELEPVAAIRALRDANVQVDLVPRMFELVGPNVGIHTLEGITLVGLPPARKSRFALALKRSFDIVGATLGLIVTAPAFAVIAILIRRETPGPVFFRQTRLGQGMQEFTMLKFRTMHDGDNDSAHKEHILNSSATADHGLFKLDRPDVITRTGRVLRKTSLDELPQLINVLRGEMSLVGPRPCIRYELETFLPYQYERFELPPGLTGLWQVTARAHSTHGESLDMDVSYVRSWSLGLDLWLICRTPLALLRQREATV